METCEIYPLTSASNIAKDTHSNGAKESHITLKPFSLGKYPVTVAQYRLFNNHVVTDRREDAVSNHPITNVSWYDAKNFCDWLGDDWRLPTDLEWEYVCRGKNKSRIWFENNMSRGKANIAARIRFIGSNREFTEVKTIPVDAFQPNPHGLYDLLGNVWEWCEDPFLSEKLDLQLLPIPETLGIPRVLRGGSWFEDEAQLTRSSRTAYPPEDSYHNVGFRVARDLKDI